MNEKKPSDWKVIDAIEFKINMYHSGELADYETLEAIKHILQENGWLDE